MHLQIAIARTGILALGIAACGEAPTAPVSDNSAQLSPQERPQLGTGLVLDNLTGAALPIVGIPLTDVVIDEAIITDLHLVEDIASGLVGLQATGVLEAHGGVLGSDVVTQDFTTTLGITSSGRGCEIVTLDLGEIAVDRLSPIVTVDVPATTVSGRGSGAVGSLLCTLSPLLNAPGRAAQAIVQALNNII
jgi:hypothetical protein